jgi:hypothetical protein
MVIHLFLRLNSIVKQSFSCGTLLNKGKSCTMLMITSSVRKSLLISQKAAVGVNSMRLPINTNNRLFIEDINY